MNLKNIPVLCALPKIFDVVVDYCTPEEETPKHTLPKDTVVVDKATKQEINEATRPTDFLQEFAKATSTIIANAKLSEEAALEAQAKKSAAKKTDDMIDPILFSSSLSTKKTTVTETKKKRKRSVSKQYDVSIITRDMVVEARRRFAKFNKTKFDKPGIRLNQEHFVNSLNIHFGTAKSKTTWMHVCNGNEPLDHYPETSTKQKKGVMVDPDKLFNRG